MSTMTILFVEDDPSVRSSLTQSLQLAGMDVEAVASAEEALQRHQAGGHAVVVTDIQLPGMDGLELFRYLREREPGIPVVLITGHGDISMAVQAMREGAYDFLEKPFAPERLIEVCSRAQDKRGLQLEIERLRQQLDALKGLESVLIGQSASMQRLRSQVLGLANTSADVLLWGETGTGKEVVARALHDLRLAPGPFVAVNCAGLPDQLFESELFGHEAGAFTGAARRRIGKFEHAKGGTLFLDEIESMPLGQQVKLLRALQERRVERLGSNAEIPIDVRMVAATKSDLKAMGDAGTFRADLYYRLSVVVLALPPLRERKEDIPVLFEHFAADAARRYGREAPVPSTSYTRALMTADWPGNVRELRNAADRFVLGIESDPPQAGPATLPEQLDAVERVLVLRALKEHAGRAQAAADALGIGRKTLYDKLHKHAIDIDLFRDPLDRPDPAA